MKNAYWLYPGVNGHGPKEWRAVPSNNSGRVQVVVIHEGVVYFRSDLIASTVSNAYSLEKEALADQLLREAGLVPKTTGELNMPSKAGPEDYSFFTADQAEAAMKLKLSGKRLLPRKLSAHFESLLTLLSKALEEEDTPDFKKDWAKAQKRERYF